MLTLDEMGSGLVQSARENRLGMMRTLLSLGADADYMANSVKEGQMRFTPLIGAVSAPAVTLLIESGADVNKKEPQNGPTPLHVAAQIDGVPVMQIMINKGARIDERDMLGQTPLHAAASHGRKKAAICLLDHMAEINAVDNDGFTPLMFAA